MKELCTEIEIKAPAERVWRILTDFPRYPDWNPFIQSVRGDAKAGARLKVFIEPQGARGFVLRPTITAFKPCRELRWLGHAVIPGLFDGEHSFTIEPVTAGSVRFVQRESFKGLLVPLLSYSLDKDIRGGFEAMNKKLKQICEAK
jgi:hypothetical protein